MGTLADRLRNPEDSLRTLLEAARKWQVPPTAFMGERTVNTAEWTMQDTLYALALEDYEAGFCPGGPHLLAETSKPEHEAAYRPVGEDDRITCHYCKAQALLSRQLAEKDTEGVFVPLVLDPEIVALNKLPVPPLPPELIQPPAGRPWSTSVPDDAL